MKRVIILAPFLLAACDSDSTPNSSDTSDTSDTFNETVMRPAEQGFIDLEVSLVEDPSVARFCLGVSVTGPTGALVWEKADICSDTFGHDGTITYIGTCDADGGGANQLEVTLAGAYDNAGQVVASGALPCGDGRVCTTTIDCVKNQDIVVSLQP